MRAIHSYTRVHAHTKQTPPTSCVPREQYTQPTVHKRLPHTGDHSLQPLSSNSIASPWAPSGTEPNQMGPYCFLETLMAQVNQLALIRAFYHLTAATEPAVSSALRPPRLPPKTDAPKARRCHTSPGTRALHSRCCHLQHWPDQDISTLDVNPWALASQQGLAVLSAVNDKGPLKGLRKGLEFQVPLLSTPVRDLRFPSLLALGMPVRITKACCYNLRPRK